MLLLIYEEAWADEEGPESIATGRSLRLDFSTLEALRKAAPGLILQHNLHGVDIDPRCAQIAQLALWMRAQRAFKEAGVSRAERPVIRRANIVIAEPMPGDLKLVKEFAASLQPAILGNLFEKIVSEMRLAGEMGPLLLIDKKLASAIERARVAFTAQQKHDAGFLPGLAPSKQQAELDLSGIDNAAFFERAEELIFVALKKFVSGAANGHGMRRKLFADDAEQGIAFVELMSREFDVVLMNPPFGEFIAQHQKYIDSEYSAGRNDIYAAFVCRAINLVSAQNGYVGAITSRAFVTGRDHRNYRRLLIEDDQGQLGCFLDLGPGVLDGAMVETAAYLIGKSNNRRILFIDARKSKEARKENWINGLKHFYFERDRLLQLPQFDLLYDVGSEDYDALVGSEAGLEPTIGRVTFGLTTKDDFRFVRLRWEVSPSRLGIQEAWVPFSKGGEYSWFTADTHLVVKQPLLSNEIAAFAETRDGNIASTRRSSTYYFSSAVFFSRRSQKGFSARRLRANACFSDKSGVIIPKSEKADWLLALAPVLASSEYQRLITARSKFGAYEIGPIKELPVPDARALSQMNHWKAIYQAFDSIDRCDETSEIFAGPALAEWSPSIVWQAAREDLVLGLANCGLTPDVYVLKNIQQWVDDKTARFDFTDCIRSWSAGVAFGRFDASATGHTAGDADPFAVPNAICPALNVDLEPVLN